MLEPAQISIFHPVYGPVTYSTSGRIKLNGDFHIPDPKLRLTDVNKSFPDILKDIFIPSSAAGK